MSNLTACACADSVGGITWRVYLTETSSKNDKPFRRYRGVKLIGRKGEGLARVLRCAHAMHKASMIVCGRVPTKVTHVMFFDQFGRVIKADKMSLIELYINQ